MAIIKAISSHAPINTVLDYVTKKEKVESRLISGIGCSSETAKEEMESTKELYGKTGGRTYKHFVQSFAPGENVSPQVAHDVAVKLAKNTEIFNGFEVLIATHEDKHHIHSHFVVNSVSYQNGRKFQMSSKDLQKLKNKSDELCVENGLSICERGKCFDGSERQGVVAWVKEKYRYLKTALEEGNKNSYVCNLKDAVENAMYKATSIEEFKDLLAETEISVLWKDTRKYITYIDSSGKRVRDSTLKKTFNLDADKESLSKRFEENKERLVENSVSNIQKRHIVAKYKMDFYEEIKTSLSRQIKAQQQVLDNISVKVGQAEGSITKLESDIRKWEKQKAECSTIQLKKRYELQEKIEHGKFLIESIQEDKENYISQYGFSSAEEIEKTKVDIQEAKDVFEKIEQQRMVAEDTLSETSIENMQNSLDDKVINGAREELSKIFAEDFSEEMFQKTIEGINPSSQKEEAISLDEERNRNL